MKKLSIILPVLNGEKTLQRTLTSIYKQNFIYDYEVVIVNDSSSDNSIEVINSFSPYLPIKLINVNLDVHCAGNSRQIAIDASEGEWITFIDQDDEFEDGALNNVFGLIQKDNLKYLCCTLLYEYNENTDTSTEHTDLRDNIDVWLHGKFYNKKNLLDKYNIRFKKDLLYLEDLYFNNLVIKTMFFIGLITKPTFTYYIIKTYKWYEHNSSTHNKLVNGSYIFNHYGVAYYYCDIVFPALINMAQGAKNEETLDAITKMAYADIGYVYVNYNVLAYNYGVDAEITKALVSSVCKYLPFIMLTMPIKNIFDYVNSTIDFSWENSKLSEEELAKFITCSFPTWWSNILTEISLKK